MLANDETIPKQVLGIVLALDELQGDRPCMGEFGHRRQGLSIIAQLAHLIPRTKALRRRQVHQPLLLQTVEGGISRRHAQFPFAVAPVGCLTEVLHQSAPGGRMVRSRARAQARQNMHTDPSSRDPHCVQHGGEPLSLRTICLALIFMGNDERDIAPYPAVHWQTHSPFWMRNSPLLASKAWSGMHGAIPTMTQTRF